MTDSSALIPTDHPVADRATWLAARHELLAAEKAASKHLDALAEQRRAMPWDWKSIWCDIQPPGRSHDEQAR